jgi:hypothetical protein
VFEVLFDHPACSIRIDDLGHLFWGVDRLGGDELPVHGMTIFGCVGFANMHNVEDQLFWDRTSFAVIGFRNRHGAGSNL